MNLAAIIVAGGLGKRFGSAKPKQFLLLNKKPMFLWSILAFKRIKQCKQIILVVPKDKISKLQKYKEIYNIDIVCGGKERYNSVTNGINCIRDNIDIVAIHDGARPLITSKIITDVLNKTIKYDCAIAACKAKDTIKFSKNGNYITKSIDRDSIWQAQTPQMFKTKLLKKMYCGKISKTTTDDAQLAERLNKKIYLVDTGYENFKITHPTDFKFAEFILKNRRLED